MLTIACLYNLVRKISEVFRTAQCRFGHELDRLARVPAFTQGDLFCAGLDAFSDTDQDFFALKRWHITPHSKSIRGRIRGSIDIGRSAMCNIANQRLINWGRSLENALTAIHILASNPISDARVTEPFKVAIQFGNVVFERSHTLFSRWSRIVPNFGDSSALMSRISAERAMECDAIAGVINSLSAAKI